MPTPNYPKEKPLGVLPDGKKHVFGSGLFGGETVYEGGKKVKVGGFDKAIREAGEVPGEQKLSPRKKK